MSDPKISQISHIECLEKTIAEKNAEIEKLIHENCKMKAREINDSPLRGYDGMVDRYQAEIDKRSGVITTLVKEIKEKDELLTQTQNLFFDLTSVNHHAISEETWRWEDLLSKITKILMLTGSTAKGDGK